MTEKQEIECIEASDRKNILFFLNSIKSDIEQGLSEKTVILNARGHKYQVLKENLAKYPTTRLGKLMKFSIEKNRNEISALCDYCDEKQNEFYFDRDPFILNMILNYYQSGKLHLTNTTTCSIFLHQELKYWQIDEFLFDSCCEFVYFNDLEEIKKILQTEEEIIEKLNKKENANDEFKSKLRAKLWKLFTDLESTLFAKVILRFKINVQLDKRYK